MLAFHVNWADDSHVMARLVLSGKKIKLNIIKYKLSSAAVVIAAFMEKMYKRVTLGTSDTCIEVEYFKRTLRVYKHPVS